MTDGWLKPLEPADLELVWNWRNREHIRKVMLQPRPIAWTEHKRWFEELQIKKHIFPYLFVENQKPVGFVSFSRIDAENQLCYWGFYLGSDTPAPGTGTRMCTTALQFAFENLGIRKLCAEVLGHNQRSIHLHKKLGFSLEGILKEHWRSGNRYEDLYLFAKFNPKGVEP